MAKVKGCSDSVMMRLWRKAVLNHNFNRCFVCGNTNASELDCHHIIKRRHSILRYDYRNGVPACRMGCHNTIDSLAGYKMLKAVRSADLEYLEGLENLTIKQYLIDRGITRKEFLESQKVELKKYLT